MKGLFRAGVFSFALLVLALSSSAASVTVIPTNAWWKYLETGADPGTAWQQPDFNDFWWQIGRAQLGYGEGDEATVITSSNTVSRPVTVYFRHAFYAPSGVTSAVLRLLRDDGAVVYVNGLEVRRDNMPAGPVAFNTLALSAVGSTDEFTFFESVIPGSAFIAGTNVIAVEVHQVNVASSDLSFALELIAEVGSGPGPTVTIETIVPSTREVSPLAKPLYAPGIARISRTGSTNTSLTVGLQITGTASNGIDFAEIPTDVIIPAGASSVDAYVVPFDDLIVESTETVVLTIAPTACPECYVIGSPASATMTIADNDLPPEPEVTIIDVVTLDADARESGPLAMINPGQFALRRSGNLTSSIPVYFTLTGTAGNGIDYHLITNPIVIPAGATQALVNVVPLDDGMLEPAEMVVLTLQSPVCPAVFPTPPWCYMVGSSSSGVVQIADAPMGTNTPPAVQINSPTNGARYVLPAVIQLRAFATDREDGSALGVEFYDGSNSLGVASFVPGLCPAPECPFYVLNWTNPPVGLHTIRARATDSAGASTLSSPISIFVVNRTNPPQTNMTLVAAGSLWKYLDNGSDEGTAWRAPGFNDSAWAAGPAQLGFGDGDEATVINSGSLTSRYVTAYFRHTFTVTTAAQYSNLIVRLLRDDGAVVYLNGVEVFRSNMPGGTIDYTTLAVSSAEEPSQFHAAEIDGSLLVNGLNVIAVEVHQNALTSSDLSFDFELIADGPRPPFEVTQIGIVTLDADSVEPGPLEAPNDIGRIAIRRVGNLATSIPVHLQISGTASNGVDYAFISNNIVIPAGVTQAVVNLVPLFDDLQEGAEFATFSLVTPVCPPIFPPAPECYQILGTNRASVRIIDPPLGTNNPPIVTIHQPTNGAVFTRPNSILLTASARDAEDGEAVTVEFYSGSNRIGVASYIPTLCPAVDCPSFYLNWSNPPAGAQMLRARATDSAGAFAWSAPVNITVLGFTNPLPTVRVIATDNSAAEPFGGAIDAGTFTFMRSGPFTNALRVFFTIAGDALNGADYQFITNNVLFPPGSSNAQVVITPIDDSLSELTEQVTVTLRQPPGSPVPAYNILSPTNATIVIRDNDMLPPETNVTLVATGSVWRYLDTGADAGSAWRTTGFDDSSWSSGPAQLGFGEGDEATVINGGVSAPETNRYITAYFRHSFVLSNATAYSNLVVRLLRDDGAVVYLNGVEVFRSNMPGGAIEYLTLASSSAEEPSQYHESPISTSALVNGLNVIAVEVHQNAVFSSDLSFDLALVGNGFAPQDPTIVSVVTTDPQASEPGVLTVVDAGQFTIRRSGNLHVAVPVHFTLAGTALNGTDYNFISNRVVIPAGATQALINVVALLDNLPEPGESVILTIQHPPCVAISPPPPECYLIGSQAQGTVTIVDNGIVTNRPPVAFWLAPPNGSVVTQGMNIVLRASAHDLDGSIQHVEFRNGTNLVGITTTGTGTNYSVMWTNPPVGTHTLRAIAVDNFNARGTSAPVSITVNSRPALTNRELHVVSLYSGLYNGGSSPNHERGDATVIVDRPGVAVTLFLSAYEPVLWNVVVNPGTILERVFLAGYYQQDIGALPAGTQLIRTGQYEYLGYNLDCASFYLSVPMIYRYTGMEISSFHGQYTAVAPFLVNGIQSDPRLRSDYPLPEPGPDASLTFRLGFHQRGSGDGSIRFVDYTQFGPLYGADGDDVLQGMRVFADPAGRYYYGVENHEVWRIDTVANTSSEMSLPAGLPGFSWAWSGAFDTVRNRFLVVSFGGEGHLYSYTPSNQQWSVVRSMDNVDLGAIAYHAATDELFGLTKTFSECDRPTLHRMDANGNILESFQLPIIPFGRYGLRAEIVSVGDYLVLLMESSGSWNEAVDGRIYVFDPRTGQLSLTARIREPRDSDSDGVTDDRDRCPYTPAGQPVDANGCSAAQRDSDSDGVPDDRDLCPNSPAGQPVNADGCPVIVITDADADGVPDARDQCANTPAGAVVNEHGCSIAQLCPCSGPWRNHREYVECVEVTAQTFASAGLITEAQRASSVAEAEASTCGRRNPALIVPQQSSAEVDTNGCRLILEGDGPVTCVIERSPDLINWTPISTNLLNGVSIELLDREACKQPRRFYRMRMP